MKIVLSIMLLVSFTAKATPVMSMKDRLRLHLWSHGLEDKGVKKKMPVSRSLPEEIERPLRKI